MKKLVISITFLLSVVRVGQIFTVTPSNDKGEPIVTQSEEMEEEEGDLLKEQKEDSLRLEEFLKEQRRIE